MGKLRVLLFCRRGATPVVGVKIKDDILSASLEVKVHSGTTVIGGRYSKTPVPDPGPLQVAVVEGFREEVTFKGSWGLGAERGGRGAGTTRGSWLRCAERAAGASGDPGWVPPAWPSAGMRLFPRRPGQPLPSRDPLYEARHKPHVATLKGDTCGVGSGAARARRGGVAA